jgi:hypothetical protein
VRLQGATPWGTAITSIDIGLGGQLDPRIGSRSPGGGTWTSAPHRPGDLLVEFKLDLAPIDLDVELGGGRALMKSISMSSELTSRVVSFQPSDSVTLPSFSELPLTVNDTMAASSTS